VLSVKPSKKLKKYLTNLAVGAIIKKKEKRGNKL